jgi:hypothetical protein
VSFIRWLAIGILLEGVLDLNLSVPEILPVHTINGGIRCRKGVVGDKGKSLALARRLVLDQVRRPSEATKGGKGIVEELFGDIFWIKISDEQVRTNVCRFVHRFVDRRLADPYGTSKEGGVVEDVLGVLGRLGIEKLDKAVAIVLGCEFVLGHVHRLYTTDLDKELRQQIFRTRGLQVSHVDGGLLISVLDVG